MIDPRPRSVIGPPKALITSKVARRFSETTLSKSAPV